MTIIQELESQLEFSHERMMALEKTGNLLVLSAASLEHLKYSIQHELADMMLNHVFPVQEENAFLRERVTRLESIILHMFKQEQLDETTPKPNLGN